MDRLRRHTTGLLTLAILVAMASSPTASFAQKDDLPGLGGGLGLDLAGLGDEAGVSVKSRLTEDPAKPGEVILAVTITTTGNSNTYGNDATSPYPTKLALKSHVGLTAVGSLAADHEPKISFDRTQKKNIGKYTGDVTFTQRFKIEAGAPKTATVVGTINFLYCNEDNCIPKTEKIEVSIERTALFEPVVSAPTAAPAEDVPPAVEDVSAPAVTAKPGPLAYGYQIAPLYKNLKEDGGRPFEAVLTLAPKDARAGEMMTLTLQINLKRDWHTLSIRTGEKVFGAPTEIEFLELSGVELVGSLGESPEPHVKKVGEENAYEFHNTVTWTQQFKRVGDAPIGLKGKLRVSVCEGERCLPPKSQAFAMGILQTAKEMDGAVAIGTTSTTSGVASTPEAPAATVGALDLQGTKFEIEEDQESTTVWGALVFAFIGGLTLNIMPCVLPVLAIKILSIVQQAGESRGRILLMNIVYTFGVISVFALLATMAAFFSLGWGQQFQQEWFRVATVLVVFVCGLNLLGVFEVLLPGMLSQAAGGGEHREGYLGAFMTGIFATLLATPCSTGYMTYALAWSVKQTTPVIYLVWCTMGLGMALPYLLIGIYPKLINWLPRPGMWMVHFKQASAFAMFGAGVWFLMAIDQRNILPVLTACVGLGFGLWMVGQLYDRESSLGRKSIVRMTALVTTFLICTLAYRMHTAATAPPPKNELPWVAFDEKKLIELRKAGKPVLIDFTADWCAICKQNEHIALNTMETADFVRKNEIVTMVADFTDESEEIQRWLSLFDSISVPLTVIVPPDPEAKIIRLAGPFNQDQILSSLERAMSRKGAGPGDAMMAGESGKMVMSESQGAEK